MPGTSQIEWLNQNSLRNYPIRENANRLPTIEGVYDTSMFVLPNYVVVDFVMSLSSELSNEIYISRMSLVNGSITFVISGELGLVSTVFVDGKTHSPNSTYQFAGVNEYAGSRGAIVIGDISNLSDDLPDGVYEYSKENTLFETRCVRPSIRNVASLAIYDTMSGYRSKKLRGDVKLIAGNNVSLKYDAEKNAVWISADSNAGYNDACDCGSETTVKTINGLSVENVVLEGDDCVDVRTDNGVITISDKCSKPCCGCAELDFINDKISILNTALMKLDTFANTIDRRITELRTYYDLSDGIDDEEDDKKPQDDTQ